MSAQQPKRFGKRRWRRPERMTLDHGPVARRKDLGVQEPIGVEPEVARRSSRIQIQVLLALFAGLCVAEGVAIGFLTGHPFIGTVSFVAYGVFYFFIAREFGDAWIVKAVRAVPSDGTRVTRLAAAEARTAQIPTPRVLIAPGDSPNAASFALRRRWLVTTAGAEALDELALEGMIAHEIVHLRDGDSSVASLFCVLSGSPELLFRGAALAALGIPLWPVAFVLRLARSIAAPAIREHRADVAAAMLTRYPPGIVSALGEAGGADTSGYGPFDLFWFAPRDGSDAAERAALIAEM